MVLYLSIIGIASIIIMLLNIFFVPVAMDYSWWWVVIAVIYSVVVQILIDGAITALCRFLPKKAYALENKFFEVSKKEKKFYEKIKIKSWKDKVWELGALGGFRKNKIKDPNSPEYIEKFILESHLGIIMHILNILFGWVIIFALPLKLALTISLPVYIVSFILNILPTFILRYNLPKLKAAYIRSSRSKLASSTEKIESIEETKDNT